MVVMHDTIKVNLVNGNTVEIEVTLQDKALDDAAREMANAYHALIVFDCHGRKWTFASGQVVSVTPGKRAA